MRREVAELVCGELLECSGQLDHSVMELTGSVDSIFFNRYRQLVGEIMGNFYLDILRDIFKEYPDLQPDSMK